MRTLHGFQLNCTQKIGNEWSSAFKLKKNTDATDGRERDNQIADATITNYVFIFVLASFFFYLRGRHCTTLQLLYCAYAWIRWSHILVVVFFSLFPPNVLRAMCPMAKHMFAGYPNLCHTNSAYLDSQRFTPKKKIPTSMLL